MKLLEREMELMREHVKEVGVRHIMLTYLFVLAFIIFIEAFASYNIQVLQQVENSSAVLREIFSIIAVVVVAFTVIANIVFLGGRKKADREFHYYFRTRPLLLFSSVAVLGDLVAIFVAHKTGYGYVVFYTSLIALNLFALLFAVYSAERAISKGI
jgi:hypothetical protein